MADMTTPMAQVAAVVADDLETVLNAANAASASAGARMKAADAAVKSAESALAAAVKEQVAAHAKAALVNGVTDAANLAVNGPKAKVPWYVWVGAGALIVAAAGIAYIHFFM
jgi:hypothetical protein